MKWCPNPLFLARRIAYVSVLALLSTCARDEMEIDYSTIYVLSKSINGKKAETGATGIDQNVSIELIFSHTLNTTKLQEALSVTGPGGPVALSFAYTNTNSTVTLKNTARLGYEAVYTLSVKAGALGNLGETLKEDFSLSFTTRPFVPANVALSVSPAKIDEAGGIATVTATLSEAIEEMVTVNLIFEGTATAGTDYRASATSINIPAKQLNASITITALQDNATEGEEAILVRISSLTNAVQLTPQQVSLAIADDDLDSNGDGQPDKGFIVNEVLFDPPDGIAGDANGDGVRSASEDEFIEFINDSNKDVDISGFTLFDATSLATNTPRHTFPANTVVPQGGVYVLFGGGRPTGTFGGAKTGVSTSANMNLSNDADVITIKDKEGKVFLVFSSTADGPGLDFGSNQSITRSPDINGGFALHKTANSALAYSPGVKADGQPFGGTAPPPGKGFIVNEVLFDPPNDLPGDANGDGVRSATADEFIEFVNDSNKEVDLSGFTLFDETGLASNTPRHVFPANSIVPPRSVFVLFGGGTPKGSFGGALIGICSTGDLNLSNASDIITIKDKNGQVFLTFNSTLDAPGINFGTDQAVTRSPDIEGAFILHKTANAASAFSPGTRTDGSKFY
jgi:hypothetical protein